ncbi:MATH and LRR domain-containing protein PFE0570w-like [Sitophilus oryzae]|uniref:MATH and LRR domain-containing protein PFE0570w-like n=1 Tax=Sitophilus oryzae TaxID=7048 RepID=A0A6J2YLD0_SITOR|nr:MATH and LRR domain-containing protein PFE0570w-like [Sitophilus oryzae]
MPLYKKSNFKAHSKTQNSFICPFGNKNASFMNTLKSDYDNLTIPTKKNIINNLINLPSSGDLMSKLKKKPFEKNHSYEEERKKIHKTKSNNEFEKLDLTEKNLSELRAMTETPSSISSALTDCVLTNLKLNQSINADVASVISDSGISNVIESSQSLYNENIFSQALHDMVVSNMRLSQDTFKNNTAKKTVTEKSPKNRNKFDFSKKKSGELKKRLKSFNNSEDENNRKIKQKKSDVKNNKDEFSKKKSGDLNKKIISSNYSEEEINRKIKKKKSDNKNNKDEFSKKKSGDLNKKIISNNSEEEINRKIKKKKSDNKNNKDEFSKKKSGDLNKKLIRSNNSEEENNRKIKQKKSDVKNNKDEFSKKKSVDLMKKLISSNNSEEENNRKIKQKKIDAKNNKDEFSKKKSGDLNKKLINSNNSEEENNRKIKQKKIDVKNNKNELSKKKKSGDLKKKLISSNNSEDENNQKIKNKTNKTNNNTSKDDKSARDKSEQKKISKKTGIKKMNIDNFIAKNEKIDTSKKLKKKSRTEKHIENGEKKQKDKKESIEDHLDELIELQQDRNVGLYVYCDLCDKVRYLPDCKDPLDLPDKWYCYMNPDPEYKSCEDPDYPIEPEKEELLIHNRFNAGSIVWAKLEGYPWWPAMIDDDPDFKSYFWMDDEHSIKPSWYNVTFFDTAKVTRAWIKNKDLEPFEINSRNKYFLPKITDHYYNRINTAVNDANYACKLPLVDRLKTFSFIGRYFKDKNSDSKKYNKKSKLQNHKIRKIKKDKKLKSKILVNLNGVYSKEKSELVEVQPDCNISELTFTSEDLSDILKPKKSGKFRILSDDDILNSIDLTSLCDEKSFDSYL